MLKRFAPALALAAALCFAQADAAVIKSVAADATSVSVVIRIVDSTDGTPETGVVFNTSGIDIEYWRYGANSVTDITEVTQTVSGAWTSGGFVHLGNGNYRVDVPDAAFASGASAVEIMGTVTGMIVVGGTVQINQPVDVRVWNGTAVATPDTAGYPKVTIKDGTGIGEIDTNAGAVVSVTTTTTTTNVTNAPTIGDFTATMKTSIGTAVAASAVASVTGNVGGNVSGSVGSVTGNVGGNVTGSVGSIASGGISEASYATTTGSFKALGFTRQGTAQAYTSGDPSVTLDAGAPFANNDIIGQTLWACGSTQGYCMSQTVDAYSSSTKKATLHAAYPTSPSGTIAFILVGTAPGAGALTAADVWTYATRVLTAGTNIALAKGSGITGFNDLSSSQVEGAMLDAALSSHTTSGSVGERLGRIPNAPAASNGGLPTVNSSNQVAGVSGNVVGSVGSVVGNVGGSVGSVTGNVGGNVVGNVNGSVGSLGTTAQTNAQSATEAALNAHTVGGELLNDLFCRMRSVLYGKADYTSGSDSTVFQDTSGSTTRVTVAYGTDNGDRTTITLGASCGN